MKQIFYAVFASVVLASSATAAPPPKPASLPDVSWECFHAHSVGTMLPEEDRLNEIGIDGDNSQGPRPRYRLQVVNKTMLKIITDPVRPMLRTERGKHIGEMTRDFTGKHQIVGWREESPTAITVFMIDFDNRLFSLLTIPRAGFRGIAQLEVLNCR
ncbi:MAG: hypothetical protein Q7V17_13765 [Afipia sp.]|nr:hypothetical protein [Afipia sp.]